MLAIILLSSSLVMTKIAVNTRLLKKGRLEGIGWFTWQSLKRIVKACPNVEFHFFFDAPPAKEFIDFENVVSHVIIPPARRIILYKLWFDYLIPAKLKAIKADLFLSPDGFGSLRTSTPQLLVMHDLNFEHHPELLPKRIARFYRSRFPKYARLAARIATVSCFSAKDISNQYGIDSNRIDVVYNGVNEVFRPLSESQITEARNRYTQGAPYLIYVGSLNPRKNIVRMLKAFDQFKGSVQSEVKLMIVGERMWRDSEIDRTLEEMQFSSEVIFTGRANDEELAERVGAALAMSFVPIFEGFGIPALEAFAAGVPLLASNTTSLPEVCGDAALLVDPMSIESISSGMRQVCFDAAYRQDAIARGFEQSRKYSWDRTAQLLMDSMSIILPGHL